MIVHENLDDLPPFRNAVLTIGSFDGVHMGHQMILQQMIAEAKKLQGESIVITFHPHPRSVIKDLSDDIQILTTRQEKAYLLEKIDIDHLVIVPFTLSFSEQEAEDYITEFLWKKFSPHTIIVGYDHRFGRGRRGGMQLLRSYADQYGFHIVKIPAQRLEEIKISSSKVRRLIEEGSIERANKLLQHPYLIIGKVIEGIHLGKKLGFPTANIQVAESNKLLPPNGIYAAQGRYKDKTYNGMLYIGHRPTVQEINKRTIEIHLFDFDQEIYGEDLQIHILKYIRPDRQLESLDVLKNQIEEDQTIITNFFSTIDV